MEQIAFTGKTAEYFIFPGDPLLISHGEFVLVNNSAAKKKITVKKCVLHEDETVIPLKKFRVEAGGTVLDDSLEIGPKDTLDIKIYFPFRTVNYRKMDKYSLDATIESGGMEYNATSVLKIYFEQK